MFPCLSGLYVCLFDKVSRKKKEKAKHDPLTCVASPQVKILFRSNTTLDLVDQERIRLPHSVDRLQVGDDHLLQVGDVGERQAGVLPVLPEVHVQGDLLRITKPGLIQSVSIARSQGLLESFCVSSSCNYLLALLHSSCSMAKAHLPRELPQKLFSKPCDQAIDALCTSLSLLHGLLTALTCSFTSRTLRMYKLMDTSTASPKDNFVKRVTCLFDS